MIQSVQIKRIPLDKRILDLCLAVVALVIFSPLMTVVALLVRFGLGSPVIFGQQRPGFKTQLFTIYKFRTMRDLYDENGRPLPDALRMTRLGKFLRSTSLDELPELWNVVKGEMSWVGPRPLLIAYLDRYSPEQNRRHEVLPGITGWAQVNGRNAIAWEDKFRLDVWYVDHQSFWLDIKILFMTVGKVIKRESINAPGEATSGEFLGNEK